MAPHSSTLAWKNPMDRGAWWAAVRGVEKSRARLSDIAAAAAVVASFYLDWASLVAQMVENLLAMLKAQVQSLSQ